MVELNIRPVRLVSGSNVVVIKSFDPFIVSLTLFKLSVLLFDISVIEKKRKQCKADPPFIGDLIRNLAVGPPLRDIDGIVTPFIIIVAIDDDELSVQNR
ncbi:hypothetical protein DERP_005795 [Dermatophagoides pteronyssinus]|uniref:Uncharacterized protein n=1 Tax=Dermatophagoides pteronyssinus TaxID=6956 RepID=A0ABQ8J9J8_DERPT|nr:hypothetical protein DERP_005795 [Dermatophagoides pteronyssinus]